MRHSIRAVALITQADSILLVCHRTPGTDELWWIPPGGGVEPIDSSIFACAQREVWEETGLKATCSHIAYVREYIQPSRSIRHLEFFLAVDKFLAKLLSIICPHLLPMPI